MMPGPTFPTVEARGFHPIATIRPSTQTKHIALVAHERANEGGFHEPQRRLLQP